MSGNLLKQSIKEVREISGNVNDNRLIVSFIYVILRDHIPAGKVEEIILDIKKAEGKEVQFTNGWLANYSKNICERLGLSDV